jgi:hypothetical protein
MHCATEARLVTGPNQAEVIRRALRVVVDE